MEWSCRRTGQSRSRDLMDLQEIRAEQEEGNKKVMELQEQEQKQETNKLLNCIRTGPNLSRKQERNGIT